MKLLFRRSNGVAIHRLVGEKVVEWLNVELPKVSNPRVDMLGRTESGALVHLEMQSRNEDRMEVRELDYYSGFFRLFNQHVRQVMLYI
ncbi:MAG: hypothetical protein HY820_33310, partial [Acidobacteria bacterium]|nr:hypothetical protein [Acidobacteriota bacterium]